MATFANAPEALLGRNDSKNPLTTCKGITSSGRPCRRALAAAKASLHKQYVSTDGRGVPVREDLGVMEYCWQHKDQAYGGAIEQEKKHNGRSGQQEGRAMDTLYPLQERSSIETMAHRLGIDPNQVRDQVRTERRQRVDHVNNHAGPPRKTVTHDFAMESRTSQRPRSKPKPKPRGFWAALCCMGADPDDYVEIVRHRKRAARTQDMAMASTATAPLRASMPGVPHINDEALPYRPKGRPKPTSQDSGTNQLLSLIPPSLSPQTTSTLLAELDKPISPHDEEGYIYIFWLTPQFKQPPAQESAQSLLAPQPHHRSRRVSDIMTEYSFDGCEPPTRGKPTIMLKIGRASNVTRRMNEWQRQCGYSLNLIRWYPYLPTVSAPAAQALYPDFLSLASGQHRRDSGQLVHKVPMVKRVERLIHLELAERQVKRRCTTCQREHREWFEVEATHAGIKNVDDCVRRWVGWAERWAHNDVYTAAS